jgi:hypothetical protein
MVMRPYVDDLCADGCGGDRGGGTDANRNADSHSNRASLRNAGIAHWRERASDDRMSLRNKGYGLDERHFLAAEEPRDHGDGGDCSFGASRKPAA